MNDKMHCGHDWGSLDEGCFECIGEDFVVLKNEIEQLKTLTVRYEKALRNACSCRPGGGYCKPCLFLEKEDKRK